MKELFARWDAWNKQYPLLRIVIISHLSIGCIGFTTRYFWGTGDKSWPLDPWFEWFVGTAWVWGALYTGIQYLRCTYNDPSGLHPANSYSCSDTVEKISEQPSDPATCPSSAGAPTRYSRAQIEQMMAATTALIALPITIGIFCGIRGTQLVNWLCFAVIVIAASYGMAVLIEPLIEAVFAKSASLLTSARDNTAPEEKTREEDARA